MDKEKLKNSDITEIQSWAPMEDKYKLTAEDEESGLKEFLYEARDTAATAVGDLLSEIGVGPKYYSHIYEMPIGMHDGEHGGEGVYLPGQYGILMWRDSEEVLDLKKRQVACTMAHEMIHSIQTSGNAGKTEDRCDTIGNELQAEGLEEGLVEALANIAMKKTIDSSGQDYKFFAAELEEFCEERGDAPLTRVSARMIQKMDKDLLAWFLTCAQDGDYKKENRLKTAFGDDYEELIKKMKTLHDYEIADSDGPIDKRTEEDTEQLIDKNLP